MKKWTIYLSFCIVLGMAVFLTDGIVGSAASDNVLERMAIDHSEIDTSQIPSTGAVNLSDYYVYEDFYVKIIDDNALEVSEYFGDDTSVIIPSEMEGFTVKKIGDLAFYGCDALTSIVIPDSVTDIGIGAFYGCKSLTNLNLNGGIRSIGSMAFSNCGSLSAIEVDEENDSYSSENGILYDKMKTKLVCCPGSLSTIQIPDGVVCIGEYAFNFCDKLQTMILPEGLSEIEREAFAWCSGLKNVYLPASVENIGESAFLGCENLINFGISDKNPIYVLEDNILYNKDKTQIIFCTKDKTSVVIPNSVVRIGSSAFAYCENLVSVVIPSNVKEIGEMAFGGCSSLKLIEMASGVQMLDKEAFGYCTSLETVTIPEGVTSVGEMAFTACFNLKLIKFPTSVKYIGKDAFLYCSLVSVLCDSGSYAETYAILNNIDLHKHTYQQSVTASTVAVNGNIRQQCTVCGVVINTVIYSPKTIVLSAEKYAYDGGAKRPAVTVYDSVGKQMNPGNYTVVYNGNINIGDAEAIVNFKGNYSGTLKKSFKIFPKNVTISKLQAKANGFILKWEKHDNQTSGYEIQYSSSKMFSSNKTKKISIKKYSTSSKTVGNLKAKRKYYVRIRSYKTAAVGTLYSDWSEVKTVKTKELKLNKKKASVYVGKSVKLKFNESVSKVKWRSSDTTVATVNSKGKVTGQTAGKAVITAKVGKKSYKATVTVKTKANPAPNPTPSNPEKPSVPSRPEAAAFGSVTGNITYYYNDYRGNVGDTDAVVILIPADGSAVSAPTISSYVQWIIPSIVNSDYNKYGIYAAKVDGRGQYAIQHIPTGKYAVYVISNNTTEEMAFENRKAYKKDITTILSDYLSEKNASRLGEATGFGKFCIDTVDVYTNQTTIFSNDFGITYF